MSLTNATWRQVRESLTYAHMTSGTGGGGDGSVVRAAGLVIERSRVRIPAGTAGEFSSPGSTLLFWYQFHPRVTAVASKRSRSFCQKCRWQVTAKHAYTLRMWFCMKRHGAWLYGVHRPCAETAAVSCGTSHASAVSTPLRWIFKKRAIKS